MQKVSKRQEQLPLVSILLPTLNRADLLEEFVDSIKLQTYTCWELIVYDDGSTDSTQSIVNKITKRVKGVHYFRNLVRQGLSETRNLAISVAHGDFVFFAEDDLILDADCLTILINTYVELTKKGEKVGAIAPRLITTYREPVGPLSKIFNYLGDSRRKKMDLPSKIDPLTGIIYRNFDKELNEICETDDVHACSLFARCIFNHVGNYSNLYTGNYLMQESDLHSRLKKSGYKLFFQPKAKTYHKEAESGGCSLTTQRWRSYYYLIRNQSIFIIRIYRIKAVYMIPFFLGYFIYGPLKFGFHWLKCLIKSFTDAPRK